MSTLVKGGRIITASDDYIGDILVEEGVVAQIGCALEASADIVLDATGKYVFPGMIDPHTHFETPGAGTVTCDDFTVGTIAAAFGGTTCVLHLALQERGEEINDALSRWHGLLLSHPPVVDVGFHMIVTDLGVPRALHDLATLPENGIPSFKLFMAFKGQNMVDDESLFRAMQIAADTNALVMVHAENGDVIEVLRQQAIARRQLTPEYHARTRPPLAEAEATNRAIKLAMLSGAPLYVVHVTCKEALEPIRRARAEGAMVWAETVTHYLFIEESMLSLPDGAKYVYTPPPREKENWEPLWQALATDVLSAISSDDSAYQWQQKTIAEDFTKIPPGAGGVENRLHMIHHFGVRKGRLTLQRMVQLLSTTPAQLFGLYPRKGCIAVGSDADLVIFDPNREVVISASTHHSNSDYNLYEGTRVVGSPEVVLVRGQVIVDGGLLKAEPGSGHFVRRQTFTPPTTSGHVVEDPGAWSTQ
jgi:dihydropyrimidinase